MNTETINEITANVPSIFEKSLHYGERGMYLTDWNVFFHYKDMEIEAAIVKGGSRCYVKGVEYWDLYVNSVYVNGKRLYDEIPFKADGKIYGNTDSENREAIEKLKQKIFEIAKLQPEYEENLKLFNA